MVPAVQAWCFAPRESGTTGETAGDSINRPSTSASARSSSPTPSTRTTGAGRTTQQVPGRSPGGLHVATRMRPVSRFFTLVASAGFEPAKATPADLQSDPFGRLGNSPDASDHMYSSGRTRFTRILNERSGRKSSAALRRPSVSRPPLATLAAWQIHRLTS